MAAAQTYKPLLGYPPNSSKFVLPCYCNLPTPPGAKVTCNTQQEQDAKNLRIMLDFIFNGGGPSLKCQQLVLSLELPSAIRVILRATHATHASLQQALSATRGWLGREIRTARSLPAQLKKMHSISKQQKADRQGCINTKITLHATQSGKDKERKRNDHNAEGLAIKFVHTYMQLRSQS